MLFYEAKLSLSSQELLSFFVFIKTENTAKILIFSSPQHTNIS